jgi:hypothetical protein
MLSVANKPIMVSVDMLNVVMLSDVMLRFVMLNVVAPTKVNNETKGSITLWRKSC